MAASPENVSDLIAKPAEKYTPEPRYVSKHRNEIRQSYKHGKSAHKTLGVASVALDTPSQYLRKRSSSVPKKPEVHHEHYRRPGYQRKLPNWQPIRASSGNKRHLDNLIDFTKRNIDEARKLIPSKTRKYYVDDRHGSAHPLKLSGLFPFYRNRKDYGQVPGNVSPTRNEYHSEPREKSRSGRRRAAGKESDKSKGRKKHEESRKRQGTPPSPRREDKLKGSNEPRESARRETTGQRRNDKLKGSNKVQRSTSKVSAVPRRQDEFKGSGKSEESTGRVRGTREDKLGREKKLEGQEKRDKEEAKRQGARSLKTQSLKAETEERVSTASTIPADYQQPLCRYVTEDDRAQLLYGMKKKWDEMMKQFQCLPFLTDTPPKAKRKSKMEKDLLKLERDIEVIERHPYIYVYSDPED